MKNDILNITRCSMMLILFVTLTISCQNKGIQKKEASLKSIVENSLGTKIMIPDSIITYKPFTNYIADSVQLSNSKFKIYSHINASCATCVQQIKLWDNLIADFEKFQIPVILIFESDDNFELFKYMIEIGEVKSFSYPFFLDIKHEFVLHNKFMKESAQFATVLTDRENNILLLGNPIHSKGMKDIYLNEIQNRLDRQ